MKKTLLLIVLFAACAGAEGRDRRVLYQFEKTHPCPATGKSHGACPGYVKDHIVPICAKGRDRVSNMQWQTAAAAHAKDVEEDALCRAVRKGKAFPYTSHTEFCAALDKAAYPIIAGAACR